MLYFVIAGLATCVALPTYYIEEDCGPYIVVLILWSLYIVPTLETGR